MEYTDEFLSKIVQLGTLGYPPSKIINILEVENENKFIKDFYDDKSTVAKSYQKGIDKADFVLDSKLFEMAKNGDLKAMEKYQRRKSDQMYDSEIEKKKRGK